MPARRIVIAAALFLAPLVLNAIGCNRQGGFDQSVARERLSRWIPEVDSSPSVLHHQWSRDDGREQWIFLTPAPIEFVRRDRKGMVSGKFPASAVISVAASVGLTPQQVSPPIDDLGTLFEWSDSSMTLRCRSVALERGWMHVLEALPE